ncbi:hypothetical protein ANCDUO_18559, partial [Ancylostoma duodenale]
MLGITRLTQVRAEIQGSTLRQQSKIRDAAAYAKFSKIRTTVGQELSATGPPRDVKRTTGRPPTPWS